jgi:hypothetical protein
LRYCVVDGVLEISQDIVECLLVKAQIVNRAGECLCEDADESVPEQSRQGITPYVFNADAGAFM